MDNNDIEWESVPKKYYVSDDYTNNKYSVKSSNKQSQKVQYINTQLKSLIYNIKQYSKTRKEIYNCVEKLYKYYGTSLLEHPQLSNLENKKDIEFEPVIKLLKYYISKLS